MNNLLAKGEVGELHGIPTVTPVVYLWSLRGHYIGFTNFPVGREEASGKCLREGNRVVCCNFLSTKEVSIPSYHPPFILSFLYICFNMYTLKPSMIMSVIGLHTCDERLRVMVAVVCNLTSSIII